MHQLQNWMNFSLEKGLRIFKDMHHQLPGTVQNTFMQGQTATNGSNTLCINLRGTKFTVESKYLKRFPSSLLHRKYEDVQKEDVEGPVELFFDHNPALFQHVWDAYAQSAAGQGMHVPSNYCTRYVEQELAFWGLDDSVLEICCWDRLMEGQENDSTLAAVVRDWEKGDMLKMKSDQVTFRQRMHLFLEEPRVSKWAMAYTSFILLVSIGSIVTWLLESVPSCRFVIDGKQELIDNATSHKVDTYLRYSLPAHALWYSDIIAGFVLTVDYILRFVASPIKIRFLIDLLNVTDLLGLMPILAMASMEFYQLNNEVDDEDFLHAMYILNIMRVLRVLRMFRILQHYKPLKVVFWAWKASYQELLLLLIIIGVSACVFGSLVYYIELYQDEIITIPHGMWWAIITMTTVGYGDVVPATVPGSFLGCLCAITGLLVIGMPIPVIVRNFHKYYEAVQMISRMQKKKNKSEDCCSNKTSVETINDHSPNHEKLCIEDADQRA